MAKNTAKLKPALDVPALVDRAHKQLTEHGVVKLPSVAPKAARDAVVSALLEHGFELTKGSLRVPLGAQLQSALAHGALISLSALPSHVRGATKAELKSTVEGAVRDGSAHRVLRGRVESVVAVGAAVLPPETIDVLSTQLSGLAKLLARARGKRTSSLLSADVREALENALQVVPTTAPKKKAATALDRVLQTVDAARDSKTGLSFIPQVLTQLANFMDEKAATAALLEAAASDLLELRPEGGLARLSQAELALCLPGPQGTRLSWARRISGETT